MKGIKTLLIVFAAPLIIFLVPTLLILTLILTLILLALGIILSPLIIIGLASIRRKVKDLAKQLNTDLRQAALIWIVLSNYPLNKLIKLLRSLNRVIIQGEFPLNKEKILVVTNHPTWLDQATLIQVMINYLAWLRDPRIFPSIGAAKDSIIRLPFLGFLETFYILLPIERYNKRGAVASKRELANFLNKGGSLIIAGPAGRDFRAKKEEEIYSPLKKKRLRKFGALCGYLAVLDGIITVPAYIEGTEKLFKISDDGQEMKFSLYNFFVRFLLLGQFQIKIIIGEPLILSGWLKEKARKETEGVVLNLADMC